MLAACASAPTDREMIDARASAARTPDEHRLVAEQYEALAVREAQASLLDEIRARQDAATAALMRQSRAPIGHTWANLGSWRLQALSEARGADEARVLAELHRATAGP